MASAQQQQQEEDDDDLGIPSIDEPFIQKYLDGREALIAQEKTQRSDRATRDYLTPLAAEASNIVAAIRAQEQDTLWNADFEEDLAKKTSAPLFPGMMFTLAKERIEGSKLFQIVKKMPKGALLHCHLGAMCDIDWLIQEALACDGMCMFADSSLDTAHARETVTFRFKFSKKVKDEPASIWDASYAAETLLPIGKAAECFPGGKDAFVSWLRNRVTITQEESLLHHHGQNEVWRKFISCFVVLASIQLYEPIFTKFIRKMCQDLHEDGVQWVDIRSDFTSPFTSTGSETPDKDYYNMLDIMQREIKAFSSEHEDFWGGRLIWTAIRRLDSKAIANSMLDCIDMKLEFPDFVAGFDMVGQEDAGRSLAELTPELFWFKKQCAQAGVDIPFYFHAGETLGDGTLTDENLFDAILLGTRRIGHAFSLYKHPLLIDMVKEKKILVESCPISNEVLRLTGSIMSHPLPALIARGVNCSLSNDDPAILGQGHNGMTHDFCRALEAWDNLGLPGLASLAENSVRWATFDDCNAKEWTQQIKDGSSGQGVRAQRMKQWAEKFEKFCQWVILEYAGEVIDDLDD